MQMTVRPWIRVMGKTGLIAKGVVYITLGIMAFMAAFEIMGQKDQDANRKGVFNFIKQAPAGYWLLGLVAAGLICYSFWRLIQAFQKYGPDRKENSWMKRVRYAFSGLAYGLIAFTAIKIIAGGRNSSGDGNQKMSQQILNQPFGQWALGIIAIALAATGIYQGWYGLSGKYKDHVQKINRHSKTASVLESSGRIGYVARSIVWLILSFLFSRAALHANASEAGDTGKAFRFIETEWGSWLLGALGLGLIAYGIFNFIRARYERL